MGQDQSVASVPSKGIGNIKAYDFVKALYYATIGGIFALVLFILSTVVAEHPRFPNWPEMVPYLKSIVASTMGYLAGQLGINNVGQIFKKDAPVVPISVDTLKDLKEQIAS